MIKNIKEHYRESNKATFFIYILLRFLVIICMIFEILTKNWNNVFLCIFTLILFTVPYLIDKKLKITLPNGLEIMILLFIFSSEILGTIQNFYGVFTHWDTMLHTINGFLCAAIGFSLVDILNKSNKNIKLSPLFVALVAFCFSMTVGVMWEFGEFGVDHLLNNDSQRDRVVQKISSLLLNKEDNSVPIVIENIDHTIIYSKDKDGNEVQTLIENGYIDLGIIDTMKDLIVNFIGATFFSIFGYMYIKNRDSNNFAKKFIPISRN